MTREEFEDAVRTVVIAVAKGQGKSEETRNLAGAILAVWAERDGARKAAARKAAATRWRGSGGDANRDASHEERMQNALDNAPQNAACDAMETACDGEPCNSSSLVLTSPDPEEPKQTPRLVSLPPPSEPPPKKTSRLSNARAREPGHTTPTWNAYAVEYEHRYQVMPDRNVRDSALLTQFLKLVPVEQGPAIAACYVQSNHAYYVSRGHPLECLVKDARKLQTEMLTGRRITTTGARRVDKQTDRGEQYAEMLERLRAEDEADEKGKVTDGKTA